MLNNNWQTRLTEREQRLIAAAPDLLAACKEFLSLEPDQRCSIDLEMMVEEAVAKVEAPADDSIPNIFEGL